MWEGKLLGHIISKEGIYIDPTRIKAIQQLDYIRNKKEIKSFNGKIYFLRRFIPDLGEHLREITNVLKSDSEVSWFEDARKYFNQVKTEFVFCSHINQPWLHYGFLSFLRFLLKTHYFLS